MHWDTFRRRVAWGLRGAALLLLGYALPQLFGYSWVNVFTLTPDETLATVQAAWFQAIGSVLAIVAAIYVGHRQSQAAERFAHEERARRSLIEGTALIYAFQGVAIEAARKGTRCQEFAQGADPVHAWNAYKEADAWQLHSIDLLPALYPSVGLFDALVGARLSYAFQNLLPANPTLRDALLLYGHLNAGDTAKIQATYAKLADRCATAHQVALGAMVALGEHPSMTWKTLKEVDDLAWYKGKFNTHVLGLDALRDRLRPSAEPNCQKSRG